MRAKKVTEPRQTVKAKREQIQNHIHARSANVQVQTTHDPYRDGPCRRHAGGLDHHAGLDLGSCRDRRGLQTRETQEDQHETRCMQRMRNGESAPP